MKPNRSRIFTGLGLIVSLVVPGWAAPAPSPEPAVTPVEEAFAWEPVANSDASQEPSVAEGRSPQVEPELPVFEDSVEVVDRRIYLAPVELGDIVELRFGIGALEVVPTEALEVRSEVEVGCRDLPEARCEKYRQKLRFETERDGSVVKVSFRGLPKWKLRKLSLVGRVHYPSFIPLRLSVGVGSVEVSAGSHSVSVEMGIGDLTVRAPSEQVASVSVHTKIGDARILGAHSRSGERRKLVGAKLQWQEGLGDANINLQLGIGDAKVVLE